MTRNKPPFKLAVAHTRALVGVRESPLDHLRGPQTANRDPPTAHALTSPALSVKSNIGYPVPFWHMVRDWQKFFDAHAERYDENGFTKHTAFEVEFILRLYPLVRGARILDVGCGTGRHAIEFARRGYQVTGLDLSEGMLQVARKRAAAAQAEVEWIQADATDFSLPERFDAAICLCEGGMGLIEQGEDAEFHDSAILRNIAASLKPNAPFVMTALNGYSIIRQMKDEHIAEGRFDPSTMRANYVDEWDLPEGATIMQIHERLFIPPEVVRMLKEAGFAVDNVYGGTAGHWAQRVLSLDEVEAMYICRKA